MKPSAFFLTLSSPFLAFADESNWEARALADAKEDRTSTIFLGKSPDKLACDTTLRAMPGWLLGDGDARRR